MNFLGPVSPFKAEAHPAYRPDIDGLRAVAILSVLVYHVSPTALPGGFIGVDVFFVISGFLISSLIFKELENGGFQFGDFYIRRVRRIFPALALVMSATLLAGWFILTTHQFAQLSKHAMGGAAFSANLLQWREAGYFDTDSRLKPFLHLWSLGIEEQFYIFWPIAVVLMWRRQFPAMLLVLILLSFGFNIIRTPHHAVGAFYLPFGRAWELLVGALLAYKAARWGSLFTLLRSSKIHLPVDVPVRLKAVAAPFGMFLIVAGLVAIRPDAEFPGWWAVLPVVGTALLIGAGPDASLNAKWLSHPLAVFIGLISYPLYLWHWPLLAFLRITNATEPMLAARIGAAFLAFLLATLTYLLVEAPLRRSRWPRTLIVGVLVAMMFVIFMVGYFGFRKDDVKPLPFQISDCSGILSQTSDVYRHCRIIGDPRLKKTLFLWGDSHANSWLVGIAKLSKQNGAKLIMVQHPGCPPVLGVRRSLGEGLAEACSSFALADHVMSLIKKTAPERIILVARWSLYTFGLHSRGALIENTFVTSDPRGTATPETSAAALRRQLPETLLQLSRLAPTLVVKTVPTLHMPIDDGLVRDPGGFEPSLSEYREYEAVPDQIIDQAAASIPNVSVFDPAVVLCTQKCHAVLKGVRLYSDDSHLTDEGALLFVPALSRALH